MRRLTSIVALNGKGVIGAKNALPWRLKTDLAFFKQTTMGNVVIMGRKTFDSLGQRPLPGRFNIVVSHEFRMFPGTSDCVGATGIAEALSAAESAPKKFGEAFVVGGQSMYEQFSDLVDRYLLTIVDKEVPDGDTYFDAALIDGPEWTQTAILSADAVEGRDEARFDIVELTRPITNARELARRSLLVGRSEKRPSSPAKVARRVRAYEPALGSLV